MGDLQYQLVQDFFNQQYQEVLVDVVFHFLSHLHVNVLVFNLVLLYVYIQYIYIYPPDPMNFFSLNSMVNIT